MGLRPLKNTKVCFATKHSEDFTGGGGALLEALNGMVADKNVKDLSYCSSPLETLEYVPPVTLLMEIYYLSENFLSNSVK